MKLGFILALVSCIPAMAAAESSFLRKSTNGSLGRGMANTGVESSGYAGVDIVATAVDASPLRNQPLNGNLGRGKHSDDVDDTSGYAGVVIVIDGVANNQRGSNDIITTCLVNAFNTIHKNANDDFELSNAFVVKSVVVPDSSSNNNNNTNMVSAKRKCPKKGCSGYQGIFWLETGYHCRLCNPARSRLSQVNFFVKDGNLHKALEAEFRNELIASGDAALAKVRRCDIDFTRPAAAATMTTASETSTFDSTVDSNEGIMAHTQDEHEASLINVGGPKNADDGTSGFAGVILSIHHVKDSLDWNTDVIPTCLVTAYNKINQKSDYTIDNAFIQKSVSIPESGEDDGDDDEELELVEFDTVGRRKRRKSRKNKTDNTFKVLWGYTGWHCRLCRPKRSMDFLTALLAAQGTDVHKDFQAEFCAELKQTGGPAMANISDCEVQFTYTSPTEGEDEGPTLFDSSAVISSSSQEVVSNIEALQGPNKKAVTSQIQIFHVTGSEFDIDGHQLLTTQAFLEAFNTINDGGGVTVTAVDLLRRIDIPQDDDDDDDDTDNDGPDNNGDDEDDDGPFDRLWWASVTFTSTGTPNNEGRLSSSSSSSSPLELLASDSAAHKAFEQLFYLKLKNSGMLAYADITGSDITFSFPTLSSSTSFEKVNSIALQE